MEVDDKPFFYAVARRVNWEVALIPFPDGEDASLRYQGVL